VNQSAGAMGAARTFGNIRSSRSYTARKQPISPKALKSTESNKIGAIYQPKAYALYQVTCQRRGGAVSQNSVSDERPLADLRARASKDGRVKADTDMAKRVRRLLHELGIVGKAPERKPRTADSDHAYPRYPNLVAGLKVMRPDDV
jgi:hypothetical protein